MLLREYKEMLEDISGFKVTNTLIGKALDTTSQNISKRIKKDSVLTTAELLKLESAFGAFVFDNQERNLTNSLKRKTKNITKAFNTWGTRLAKIQAANSLSDSEMCSILNISNELYNDILCNEANPTIELIKSIAENFDVDLNWLFLAKSETKSNSDLINSLPPEKVQKLLKLLED